MTEQEIKKFKAALKKNGQSLTWFHGKYLKQKITRNAMYLQLDKVRPSEDVQKAIHKYLKLKAEGK